MEIDITKQFNDSINGINDSRFFSGSVAELGSNAGQVTWNNALNAEYQYVTEENREEVLNYFLAFGAWEKEDIDSIKELNALLVQEIAHQIRDFEDIAEEDWKEYEKLSNEGTISGKIHGGSLLAEPSDKVYMYVGF